MRVEEEAEDAATIAFLEAPICRRRRQRLGPTSSESSTSGLSDSQEAKFFDSSSKCSFDDFDSGDDEGEKEEEEDDNDDEEEMEYLALDYLQEDSKDDMYAYAPRSP